MLSDEPIDEDLEALLYAQVYYGKGEETELQNLTETELTELSVKEKDQVGVRSEETNSSRHIYQKKRYFENNLVQQDKEKENEDTVAKKSSIEPLTKENSSLEVPVIDSITSDIPPKESSLQNQILPTQQDQDLESIDTQTPQHQLIEISTSSPSLNPSEKTSAQVVTSVPLLSTPNESNQPQLLNNITINQYLYPPNFVERLRSSIDNLPISKRCKRDLNRLKKGDISEQVFFNNLKRRLKIQKKQQTQIRKAYLKKQKNIAVSEVICLSDSDNSDIEVVEVTNISLNTDNILDNMNDNVEVCLEANRNDTPDDDEIIYIAPPPVPVINVDTDSDSGESDKDKGISEKDAVTTPANNEEAASQNLPDSQLDDFLQPKNTPENFNFSLHGSDFQNSEFLRPMNPTDVYETESSTSTSDFNRDSSRQFCNSVKTIVFNEVDFPNQDIFDEINLESFGEFITPKRGDKDKSKQTTSIAVDQSSNSKGTKRISTRTSSESSSESEYEGPNTHGNLPDLSPMVCATTSHKKSKKKTVENPKKKKGKAEEEVNIRTRSNKSKSKEKFSDKNDGILDVEHTLVEEEPIRKKRKSCEPLADEETPRKKNKKKKSKSSNKSAEETEEVSEAPTSERNISRASPTKSLKVTSSKNIVEDEAGASSASGESLKKKSKKKKKIFRNEESGLETDKLIGPIEHQQEVLAIEGTEDTIDSSGKRKGKKKKGKEKTVEDGKAIVEQREDLEENNEVVTQEQDRIEEDNGKRKNKKQKQKETSESRTIVDATINDEHASKSIEGNSLNMSSGNQEVLTGETGIPEENSALKDGSCKKKNKRKKRDKRSSVEKSNVLIDQENNAQDLEKDIHQNSEKEELEEGEIVDIEGDEGKSNENNIGKSQNEEEEDIIIIEQAIPVHTIESSESEQDDDILTFEGVGYNLELANISDSKDVSNKVIEYKNYDVDFVQSKMSDDPEKWKILHSDRYNLKIAKRGPRCRRCRQLGHIAIYCPNKPAVPNCSLCGEPGHQEPRCPNKVCFTCGKPGSYSTVYCYKCVKQRKARCQLCSIKGHNSSFCPDLWRRYFLTTTEGPLKIPRKNCPTLKPRNKQWCSGCASNGHLEFECDTYKWIREYPASSPNIFKYYNVYEGGRREQERRASNSARRLTALEEFVASKLKISSTSSSAVKHGSTPIKNTVQNVVEILESPEQNQDQNNSFQEINGNTVESHVDSTAENQMGNQQITENQYLFGTFAEHQNNDSPEVNSGLPNPNSVQNTQIRANLPNQQMTGINQVQSPSSHKRHRPSKSKKKSPSKAKINPVSVLRQPRGYSPYQSVLNPYSLLGAPSALSNSGLFNQVPNDILAKQLADLASAVAGFQRPTNFNQNNYFPNQNESNFYHSQQFGAQIPDNLNPLFGAPTITYQDFSDVIIPEPYYDIQEPQNMYDNREFLDRPHTITRDPMEDRQRLNFDQPIAYSLRERDVMGPTEFQEKQLNIPVVEGNFREQEAYRRDTGRYRDGVDDLREPIYRDEDSARELVSLEPSIEQQTNDYVPRNVLATPEISQTPKSNDFISLNSGRHNNAFQMFRKARFDNVDPVIIKKFESASIESLKEFISDDLQKLDKLQQTDTKKFRKKLNRIEYLKKIVVKTNSIKRQLYFHYKQINMFLFGVHRLHEGNKNLNLLRQFSSEFTERVGENRRRTLLQAYGYIFGGEHPKFNYRRCFNTMTVINRN